MATKEGQTTENWARGISEYEDFDKEKCLELVEKAYQGIHLELDLAKAVEDADLVIESMAENVEDKIVIYKKLAPLMTKPPTSSVSIGLKPNSPPMPKANVVAYLGAVFWETGSDAGFATSAGFAASFFSGSFFSATMTNEAEDFSFPAATTVLSAGFFSRLARYQPRSLFRVSMAPSRSFLESPSE